MMHRMFWVTLIFGLVVISAPVWLSLDGTDSPSIVFYIFGAIIIIFSFKMKMKKKNGRR